jgi:hypothetical protein
VPQPPMALVDCSAMKLSLSQMLEPWGGPGRARNYSKNDRNNRLEHDLEKQPIDRTYTKVWQ